MKIKKVKKESIPTTRIIFDYIKETSKNLLDLSVDIVFDPQKLVAQAGFTVKYPSLTCLFSGKKMHDIKNGSNFRCKNGNFYLTDKGRIKIIKNIIKAKNNNKEWDGKWRAIIFDIPELNRKERRFLRTELKWLKFRELQKSIWVCPYNIEKELYVLLKLWKLDFKGDIRFLRIEKIEEDRDIKRYFKL